jgi:hypothetical protein
MEMLLDGVSDIQVLSSHETMAGLKNYLRVSSIPTILNEISGLEMFE